MDLLLSKRNLSVQRLARSFNTNRHPVIFIKEFYFFGECEKLRKLSYYMRKTMHTPSCIVYMHKRTFCLIVIVCVCVCVCVCVRVFVCVIAHRGLSYAREPDLEDQVVMTLGAQILYNNLVERFTNLILAAVPHPPQEAKMQHFQNKKWKGCSKDNISRKG